MIAENLHPVSKGFLVRGGDARVFGPDSHVRRQMSDDEVIERFRKVWEEVLEPEVRRAPIISPEEARELLEGKQREYALSGYQYRQFSFDSAVFVARMNAEATENGACDQLWSLGAHRDPTRLCMFFRSVEEKQRFEAIARRLNFEPKFLALELTLDFMRKFPESRRPDA